MSEMATATTTPWHADPIVTTTITDYPYSTSAPKVVVFYSGIEGYAPNMIVSIVLIILFSLTTGKRDCIQVLVWLANTKSG